eukprot:PhM_4_TR8453/c2_g1_i4/m.1278
MSSNFVEMNNVADDGVGTKKAPASMSGSSIQRISNVAVYVAIIVLLGTTITFASLYATEASKSKTSTTANAASSNSAAALSPLEATEPFLTIVQINDVYELKPVGGLGGLARAAGLKNALSKHNGKQRNVFCVLAGDVISPSAMSDTKVDGKKLNGKHMIDVTNAFVDLSVLGNHEFDYDEDTFKERMSESKYPWLTTNMNPTAATNFTDQKGVTTKYIVKEFKDPGTGWMLRVAFVGIVRRYESFKYVDVMSLADTVSYLKKTIAGIRGKHSPHILIAVTHLSIDEDVSIATAGLDIDFLIGGHEHENSLHRATDKFIPITKADANAVTAFVHELRFIKSNADVIKSEYPNKYDTPTFVYPALYTQNNAVAIGSKLVPLTSSVPDDAETSTRINKWWGIANTYFKTKGYNLDEVAGKLPVELDLRDSTFRGERTATGAWISFSFNKCIEYNATYAEIKPQFSIFNSGIVRLNAVVPISEISVYDIFRIYPHIGDLITIRVRGDMLKRLVKAAFEKNVGLGGFLQMSDALKCDAVSCKLNGNDIDDNKQYYANTVEYLTLGLEENLEFFKKTQGSLEPVTPDGMAVQIQKCMQKALTH